jgi:phage terminase small subunit
MTNELTIISPENLEIANCFLQYGNVRATADYMNVPQNIVVEALNTKEVKRYIDNVYLDLGYRNRENIASVMDTIIQSKLEEAEETGMYTTKDLVDLMQIAHKMRMDEIKAMNELEKNTIKNQTNIQVNETNTFGSGNYGKLMERLLAQKE